MKSTIISDLANLGCRFAKQFPQDPVDPEITILQALNGFWEDKKIFTMLIGLLKFRLHQLINTKRLCCLAQKLSNSKRAVLYVLALKTYKHTKDERYLQLAGKLKKMGVELSQCPSQYKDLFYIQRKGVDKDFNKLKLKLADFFDIQPEQKFETFPQIYKENLWLRLRALIGADYRADVIYLKMSGLAKNQVQAAKVIGCNKSSVNRIWNSIEDFDSLVSHIK